MSSILVFGSLNMDLVTQVSQLPIPGETRLGSRFLTFPGGKGANQAVAVARLGIPTRMVGRVGLDGFGEALVASLKTAGVNVAAVEIDPEATTGIATIAVDVDGDNTIIVIPGANAAVDATDLQRLTQQFADTRILMLQLEIPLNVVHQAAKLAHNQGITVIVDPAPAPAELPAMFYQYIDILTPNQSEAAQLVGFAVETPTDALAAAQQLRSRGVKTVIVKLGHQGCVYSSAEGNIHLPAYTVTAVDTVAAGDAFNGGLAAALCQGQGVQNALQYASAVAALSVTQTGAQQSLPTRNCVTAFIQERGSLQPIDPSQLTDS